MEENQIHESFHGSYHWLTSTEAYSGTFLKLCPEAVLDRYVAVTSIDGGVLQLTDQRRAAGWQSRHGIACSPKINSIDEIPHQLDGPDGPGYDEFYVFENPCDLGERCQGNIFTEPFAPRPGRTALFVSWSAFILHSPDPGIQALVDLFWPQLERLQPESYIADGSECLTFVSRRKEFIDRFHEQLLTASG